MTTEELTATSAAASSKAKVAIDALLIALFVVIITVCAWIKIPGPVPVTLQTMAVFMAVSILGTKRGTAAVGSYIVLGLLGLPVFAGFAGGFAYLFGLTGGYIIGFLPTAFLTGWLIDRFGKTVPVMIGAMFAGLLVCYAFGTIWFIAVSGSAFDAASLQYVLSLCVYPFIIPDAIKIAAAVSATKLVGFVGKARTK
ncbi:MAG: biotin transporter BioY [Coriobacteriales bacterium]|jgi:biotin transport system substrate-specific component